MDDKFEPLQPDEVASLREDWKSRNDMFNLPLTFKPKELQSNIAEQITNYWKHYQQSRRKLFNEGLDGEVLKFGADGWKKGKIRCRIIVEFCPSELEEEETEETEKTEIPEEPEPETNQIEINNFDSLDDLRRELNQDNS